MMTTGLMVTRVGNFRPRFADRMTRQTKMIVVRTFGPSGVNASAADAAATAATRVAALTHLALCADVFVPPIDRFSSLSPLASVKGTIDA
jgi:hypothetical protein